MSSQTQRLKLHQKCSQFLREILLSLQNGVPMHIQAGIRRLEILEAALERVDV